MDDGHVLGTQHLVHGILLCAVQVKEVEWGEGERLRRLVRVEQVTQIAQPTFCAYYTVESVEHGSVGCLVEKQLYAHPLGTLHIDEPSVVRHDHHHAVAIDIADGRREVEVADLALLVDAEEGHRPAELEVLAWRAHLLGLLVGGMEDFEAQLVERIVVAAPHAQGPPGIAALHLPRHTHFLGLASKGLLLSLIFQLQQEPLLL